MSMIVTMRRSNGGGVGSVGGPVARGFVFAGVVSSLSLLAGSMTLVFAVWRRASVDPGRRGSELSTAQLRRVNFRGRRFVHLVESELVRYYPQVFGCFDSSPDILLAHVRRSLVRRGSGHQAWCFSRGSGGGGGQLLGARGHVDAAGDAEGQVLARPGSLVAPSRLMRHTSSVSSVGGVKSAVRPDGLMII